MRVLLEPAGPGSPAETALSAAGRATQRGESVSLAMVHDSAQLRLGTYAADARPSIAGSRVFVQIIEPPPHLLICGAAPDAQPVAGAARALGWRVTVVDHRPAYAVAARFAGADVRVANPKSLRAEDDLARCHAAVVMSHHLHTDEAGICASSRSAESARLTLGCLAPKHAVPGWRRNSGPSWKISARGFADRSVSISAPRHLRPLRCPSLRKFMPGLPAGLLAKRFCPRKARDAYAVLKFWPPMPNW